jgi:hypothetical protein
MRRAFFASGVGAVMLRRYAAIAMVLRGSFRLTLNFRASVTRGSRSMLVIDAAGASTTSGLVHMAGMRLRWLRGKRLSPRVTILVVRTANASTKETPFGFLGLSGGSGDLVKGGSIYNERPGAFRPILADSLAFSVALYMLYAVIHLLSRQFFLHCDIIERNTLYKAARKR